MATYPALKQTIASTRTRLSGLVADEGGNLTLWMRNMAPTEKFKFSLFHVLVQSQLDTLMAFYAANKTTPFDLVFRDNLSVTHTNCLFLDAPQKVAHHSKGLFTYRVDIRTQ